MAYIGKQPTVGNFVKLDAIVTSATATYNLLNGGVAYSPQSANHCLVSLNGILQAPTDSFTISGSTIIFSSALTVSDVIDFIIVLGDVLNIGTPSDATVTNVKLALTAGSAGTPTISPTSDTNTGIFFPASDTIGFAEGGTEGMRIDSSGNVGIGETSVASKLHIKSDGSVNACARMNNTEAGTGSSNTVIFQRNGTNIGFITATGTATGYVTSSDYRLKENVVYNLNGIERIKLLKPARFNFIVEPNKIVDGFIAHEVSDIVPEAIHGTKDQIDSEGKPVHQGIDQSKIVPLLTGALQEAIAKIEQLEARLTALENN